MINDIFKYIITEQGAVLFPETVTHALVARGFKEVYSAGFVKIDYNKRGHGVKAICHGESTSTGLKSKPELDKHIIEDMFEPISKIKYYGFSVKDVYEEEKNKLINPPTKYYQVPE